MPLHFDPKTRIGAPPWAPNGLLNRASIAIFNEFWYRVSPATARSVRDDLVVLPPARRRPRLEPPLRQPRVPAVPVRRPRRRARGRAPLGRDVERRARGVVPRRAQALRCREPRAAVVPRAGLDPRARHPRGRARARRSCSTTSTSSWPASAGACTWRRTRGSAPSSSRVMYPDLARFAELRARVDPAGVLQSDLRRRLGLP